MMTKEIFNDIVKQFLRTLVIAQDEKHPIGTWMTEYGWGQSFMAAISVQAYEERLKMIHEGLPVRKVTIDSEGTVHYEGDDHTRSMM